MLNKPVQLFADKKDCCGCEACKDVCHKNAIFERKDAPCQRFYFGSTWWCLNRRTVDWVMNYLEKNPRYYQFFSTCLCPDESFFHTLVMLSPYSQDIEDYLHYIDWSEGKNSPKTFRTADVETILKSGKLMARKFDIEIDRSVVELLNTRITGRKKQ